MKVVVEMMLRCQCGDLLVQLQSFKEEGLQSQTQCSRLAHHTERSGHTCRIHPNHSHVLESNPSIFLSTPPTTFSLMAAGTDCCEPATAACCEHTRLYQTHFCVCVCVCVRPIVQQAWLSRRPAGAQTGSQIISLCSDPNSHTYCFHTVLTETLLQTKWGQIQYCARGCPKSFGKLI